MHNGGCPRSPGWGVVVVLSDSDSDNEDWISQACDGGWEMNLKMCDLYGLLLQQTLA